MGHEKSYCLFCDCGVHYPGRAGSNAGLEDLSGSFNAKYPVRGSVRSVTAAFPTPLYTLRADWVDSITLDRQLETGSHASLCCAGTFDVECGRRRKEVDLSFSANSTPFTRQPHNSSSRRLCVRMAVFPTVFAVWQALRLNFDTSLAFIFQTQPIVWIFIRNS